MSLGLDAVSGVLCVITLAAAARPSPFAVPLGCFFIGGGDHVLGSGHPVHQHDPKLGRSSPGLNGLTLLLLVRAQHLCLRLIWSS